MSTSSFLYSESLGSYVQATWLKEPGLLAELREETARMSESNMQISPDQGQFMSVLIQALRPMKCLEVGVFTGYSSTVTALALPQNGRLVACDISEEYTEIAKRYWAKAGVAEKIDLRVGPALSTLDQLLIEGEAGTFDFAFIDADKPNYIGYWDRAVRLLRAGGVLAVDNVLWSGAVADEGDQEPGTLAIREFNEHSAADSRMKSSLVPIGDGITLGIRL